MDYYYLISSLPMLRSDGEMPLSYDKFLDMCRSSVGNDMYSLLEGLTLSSNHGSFLSAWADFYVSLPISATSEWAERQSFRLAVMRKSPSL